MRKVQGFIILLVVMVVVIMSGNTKEAEAASKYIEVGEYIEYIVKAMEWDKEKTEDKSYIDIAIDKGVIKKGEYKNLSAYLTRTDAAVIANRLDEIVNLKYGYPQDVYEFLRDCNLYEGKLYYNTDGALYPKGATRDTYPEEMFNDEVVMPILGEYFKDDNWKDRGLKTVYEYIRDDKGTTLRRYMEIGLVPENVNFFRPEPLSDSSEIVKAWNIIKDGERKYNAVIDKRISDIKDIPKSKREAVASIVAKGIIKGYSNGMYVQNRQFRGNKKITVSGAKSVIDLVLNPIKRALISPDGQLIRTTKLPKNYKDYKYILECFPNEYYVMNYQFMYLSGYKDGSDYGKYKYPNEIDYKYLYDNYYDYQFNIEMDKYELYDLALSQAEKYLQHILNVDYRTVNDKWKEGLDDTFNQGNLDWRIPVRIDKYVSAMKKNRVIVECEKIAIDPGTLYECDRGLYVRAYVRYKVTADNINVEQNELIYGEYAYLKDLKNGVWRYGYFDIWIRTCLGNNGYQWGVSSAFYMSDGWNNLLH